MKRLEYQRWFRRLRTWVKTKVLRRPEFDWFDCDWCGYEGRTQKISRRYGSCPNCDMGDLWWMAHP